MLGILAGGVVCRLFGESFPDLAACSGPSGAAARSEVERVLDANFSIPSHAQARVTAYSASAVVTLLGIPVFSRTGVGSGYAVVEEATCPAGNGISIQFGAGTWPEAAHGLNRFGIIHEVALEKSGEPDVCAYFAFMTSSPEKDLSQARQALVKNNREIPCTAAQGRGDHGGFASRVENLTLPARLTWRDADQLAARVRGVVAGSPCAAGGDREAGRGAATTFLYLLRRAMVEAGPVTQGRLFFNRKQYILATRKEADPATGARLAERHVTSKPDGVVHLSATLTNCATGHVTPFHVWYEAGAEGAPPLRFEYQVKSFLKLAFEADPAAPPPPVKLVLKERQA